jgi:hydrogenase/urease accessory protein HupE
MSKLCRRILFLAIITILGQPVSAHAINYAMEQAPTSEVWWFYSKLGYLHILPYGLDHIVFVIGLCLLSNNIKTIAYQATAFTVAHSITLALSLKGIISAPSTLVEPIIALSIAFIAVENIMLKELKSSRIFIIFLFGLIHGMGFASSLNEIGLPRNQFLQSVLAFNVGVEIGQLSVIALVYGLVIRVFGDRRWYRERIVFPLSALIAVVAVFWTIERIVHMT